MFLYIYSKSCPPSSYIYNKIRKSDTAMAYTKPGKPGSRSHMPDSKNGTSMILFNLRKNMYKGKIN